MGNKVSGFLHAMYDSKRREFLGRDGARWAKLGVFYFFFYLGLAGFFCAMLALFMAYTPRDRPRYLVEESRMQTRSNPLSPGLGFRPQPEVDKNLILVDRQGNNRESQRYVTSLDQYLQVYYWKTDRSNNNDAGNNYQNNLQSQQQQPKKFVINRPGECTNGTQYGFAQGRPCVLVKMNKVVGFMPEPPSGSRQSQQQQQQQQQQPSEFHSACTPAPNSIPVQCYGEYPADEDNIGNIRYISENGQSNQCGALDLKWFPYEGKSNREDIYQAPYVWVQFTNPKPNVLINVLCRIYGQNIDFDKKAGRALTRFQIYVQDPERRNTNSRGAGDI